MPNTLLEERAKGLALSNNKKFPLVEKQLRVKGITFSGVIGESLELAGSPTDMEARLWLECHLQPGELLVLSRKVVEEITDYFRGLPLGPRTGNHEFLEACQRYYHGVAKWE